MSAPVAQDGKFSAGPPQGKLAPSGGSAVHAVTSVGAAAAPGRPKQGTAPSGGSAVHAVTSVGAISPAKEIILAEPRGFCAGVDRAIEIVERALLKFGAPIYVRHEIVHNTYVVNDLKAKGAIFIEELDDVPAGATLVFSAHGVSRAVQDDARARGFRIFDATCPLVTKVHVEVAKLHRDQRVRVQGPQREHGFEAGQRQRRTTQRQQHEALHLQMLVAPPGVERRPHRQSTTPICRQMATLAKAATTQVKNKSSTATHSRCRSEMKRGESQRAVRIHGRPTCCNTR